MKRNSGTLMVGILGGMISFAGLNYFFPKEPTAFVIEKKEEPVTPFLKAGFGNTEVNTSTLPDFTYAADRTLNSVVHIRTEVPVTYAMNRDPLFEYFFGPAPRRQGVQEASGSGVIIGENGYIATNNHVIEGAEKIMVTLNNNKAYEAELVGADPGTDIALLKIKEKGLPAIALGNSDDVKVGEWVLAVGNPFNLTSTVTAGIVSAKSRSINILSGDPSRNVFPIESFIQTDAAVNPGNSGGALVNGKGELIGINTAIASNTGSYAGYSFAVPVDLVKKVTTDLMQYGIVQRAFLGVNIRNMDQALADQIGVKNVSGVYVGGVVEGGAASESGIQQGDIITAVGEKEVVTVAELQEQVGRYRPGETINVRLRRGQEERMIKVLLRNSEGTTEKVEKREGSEIIQLLGASLKEADKDDLDRLSISGGVEVEAIGPGKLKSAGIRPGFIITAVDQRPVKNLKDLEMNLKGKRGGILLEGIYPDGSRKYYAFGV